MKWAHNGIEGAVSHGQPVEAEIDVLDVGEPHDLGVVVGVDEVDVVGEPADAEHRDDHRKHLDNLPFVFPTLDGAVRDFSRSISPEVFTWCGIY